jgi:DNA ligase (NAD+)
MAKKRSDVGELKKSEAQGEVDELRDSLERANRAYYAESNPIMADSEYDKLFRRLQTIEERFPDLDDSSSPTHRVGAPPVDELPSAKHTAPMLSLHSVLDESDARSQFESISKKLPDASPRFVIEPKFDGLSLEVVYETGRFQRAVTRGDGRTGDEVSNNAQTIRTLPLRLVNDPPRVLAIRGEVVLRKSSFTELNTERLEQGKEPFANPRNAASGSMRQLDSRNTAQVPLDLLAYDILQTSDEGRQTHDRRLEDLEAWGFTVSELVKAADSFDELRNYRDDLMERRDELDIELDGIVVKVNSLEARSELGERDRSPRWAFAWKFPPRKEATRIQSIAIQVGRTGKLTPVALLNPVEIGGVTVSRVSLHNAEEVERLDVREGDKIRLERAGDVIPHVVERIPERGKKRSEAFAMPANCPACEAEIIKDGAYHKCPNGLACPAQLKGAMEHYASREALDIDRLGEKTAELLVDQGLVQELADLYRLSVDQVAELPGFAPKSAGQLVDEIQGAKDPPFDRFLYALGISGIGLHLARILARHFENTTELEKATRDELEAIGEVGPENASNILAFFEDERTKDHLENLFEQGVSPVNTRAAEQAPQTLEGLTFVVTGSLETFSRAEAKDQIERHGGRATASVSGNTDYLVVGENPGSKLDEAKENSVKVINEEEFQKLLKQGP